MAVHHRIWGVSVVAMAATLAWPATAHAQVVSAQVPAPSGDVAPMADQDAEGEILVTGTRASLQSASQRKKNADTVVDSIVADDVASFPDKNVGEALARVTGVQLERDYGEGVRVAIRGVQPELNRVEINGVSQQSAAGERSGDFRELAVELVKAIDVFKGYSADLTEGGIGGTVKVETRRPLELKEPLFSIKGEAQRLNLSEKWRPRFNLLAARSDLLGGDLGVILNVTHSTVDTRGDSVAGTDWRRNADFDRSTEKTIADPLYANFNTYESCAGVSGTGSTFLSNRLACETQFFDWNPITPRYRSLSRKDARTSIDGQVQVRLAKNFSAWAQATINIREGVNTDINYLVDGSYGRLNLDRCTANCLGTRLRPTQGTFTVQDHVVTSWTTTANATNIPGAAGGTSSTTAALAGANGIVQIQRRDFTLRQGSEYYQTGFKWELDRMRMTFLASRSNAHRTDDQRLVKLFASVGGITVDRRNDAGLPVFTFPSNFDPNDIQSYGASRVGPNGVAYTNTGPGLEYRPTQRENGEDQLKLDVDYDLDWGFLTALKFGGQYRDQNLIAYASGGARIFTPEVRDPRTNALITPAVTQYNNNITYSTVIGTRPAGTVSPTTYYFTPAQYGQFLTEIGGTTIGAPTFGGLDIAGLPGSLATPIFNPAVLSRYYDLTNFNQDRVRFADGLPQIPAYIINEKIVAGYARADFRQELFGMELSGNAGLRYVYTRDTSTSSNTRRETRLRQGTGVGTIAPVYDTNTVAVQQIAITNDYVDLLPAVNVALTINPELILRANYAKNLARPNPSDLSPAIDCTIDVAGATTGDIDVCSAGNPRLQPYRADQYEVNIAWFPNADTTLSLGYYYKDINTFILPRTLLGNVDLFGDGVLYDVNQPTNGFGAKLDGVELSAQTAFTFLPAPFDGFGATGNVTFSRALNQALTNQVTGQPIDGYPNLSKWTHNASLYYDKGFLNARISYNHRSPWLEVQTSTAYGGFPGYRRAETYIDAKVQLRLNSQATVSFEALNLTNELQRVYIDDARPVQATDNGRRIFVGFQYRL